MELSEFSVQQEKIKIQTNDAVLMIRDDLGNFLKQDRVDKSHERDRFHQLSLRQVEFDAKVEGLSKKLDIMLEYHAADRECTASCYHAADRECAASRCRTDDHEGAMEGGT